jgi:hypothetical protein
MKLLISPPELSGNPTSIHLAAEQEELEKELTNLALRSIFGHTSKRFLTCRKILDGADGFTSPPMEVALPIFIVANLGSNGKYASQYTANNES